jgi:hypothetical protein
MSERGGFGFCTGRNAEASNTIEEINMKTLRAFDRIWFVRVRLLIVQAAVQTSLLEA